MPACLHWRETFGRALHTTPLVGVASTVVPGCTSAMATCADSKTRRAAPHRPTGTAGSSATRRAAPAPQEASRAVCGIAWVCMGSRIVRLGGGRENSGAETASSVVPTLTKYSPGVVLNILATRSDGLALLRVRLGVRISVIAIYSYRSRSDSAYDSAVAVTILGHVDGLWRPYRPQDDRP